MRDERTAQADLMRQRRQVTRDIEPRPVKNQRRRRSCEHDDPRFLRTYLRHVFYNAFTSAQEQFIEDCGRALKYGTRKAKAMPRGGGKSSIVKYLQLKYALYRQLRFPLIIAATSHKATQILKDIKTKLRSPVNKELHEDFPFETKLARYVAAAPSRANNVTWGGLPVHLEWAPERIILPSLPDGRGKFALVKHGLPKQLDALGPILSCLGFTSDDLQGCNIQDVRPDFVMLDDLDSRDSLAAEHGVIAAKIEDCIDKTVAGLGGPGRRLGRVFICTITSRRSAAFKYTDREQKPAWDGERVPRIIEWPTRRDLWDKYVDLRTANITEDKYGRKARDLLKEHFKEMHEGAVLSNPTDYNTEPLEDGEPEHLSALQKCYDYITDEGMESFLAEHQNNPPEEENKLLVQVTPSRMTRCVGDLPRQEIDSSTTAILGGMDIRKTEVHWTVMAGDPQRPHQIIDYNVRSHGTTETTVEQAELLILESLHRIADDWDEQPYFDENGMRHSTALTLIDKGWVGSWTEDGQFKTWATQPVETFCMERSGRLRKWLPAKGAPNYTQPAPGDTVIVGDHWHMNRGEGKNRRCTEIIWDASHWHLLVEELFMLPVDDTDRFELFIPEDGIWRNHKAFGEHITQGATLLKEQLNRGTRTKKPRFVRDHWWDACAMMLVAKSVEQWFRDNVRTNKRAKPVRQGRRTGRRSRPEEIGAR